MISIITILMVKTKNKREPADTKKPQQKMKIVEEESGKVVKKAPDNT
jgi:hypothetical protein